MATVTLPSIGVASVVLVALSFATSGAAPVAPVGPSPSPSALVGPTPSRNARAPTTKTFDQRQQGTTNIQAHLDNIVVILVPSNRLSITDFAAKTEPEPQHKPSPAVNKLLQQLSALNAAPSSMEAQSADFFNAIPNPVPKPELHVAQIGSIPVIQTKEPVPVAVEPKEAPSSDAKPVAPQTDGAGKKFPFQIDTNPLEIPVLVIQDP